MLIAFGKFEAMFDHLRAAEILAAALEDQRRLGWVSAYLSCYLSNTGDNDRAVETAQRALAIATASGDFALEVMATFFLGLPYFSLGDSLLLPGRLSPGGTLPPAERGDPHRGFAA